MTLPHGFGGGGESRCPQCKLYRMEYNYDLNRKVCTNCGNGGEEQIEKIGIPITKKQLGQGLWFGLLLGTFIWALVEWNWDRRIYHGLVFRSTWIRNVYITLI